jgi:hypothetical protein
MIMEHKGSQNNAEEQFVIYILPLLAFHTETWALIDRNKSKVIELDIKCLKSIARETRGDKIRN